MQVEARIDLIVKKLKKKGIVLNEEEMLLLRKAGKLLEKAVQSLNRSYVPGHDLEHVFRVTEIALYLRSKYGGDFEKLVLASLFHDILRTEKNHAEKSAIFTKKFLLETEFRDVAEDVAQIILEHSYSGGSKPSSLESAILQDADKLDALGAIGVARVFAYSAHLHRDLYNPLDPKKGGALKHFYDKILKLPKLINLPLAKIIAEERAKFVLEFLDKFEREIDMEDIA